MKAARLQYLELITYDVSSAFGNYKSKGVDVDKAFIIKRFLITEGELDMIYIDWLKGWIGPHNTMALSLEFGQYTDVIPNPDIGRIAWRYSLSFNDTVMLYKDWKPSKEALKVATYCTAYGLPYSRVVGFARNIDKNIESEFRLMYGLYERDEHIRALAGQYSESVQVMATRYYKWLREIGKAEFKKDTNKADKPDLYAFIVINTFRGKVDVTACSLKELRKLLQKSGWSMSIDSLSKALASKKPGELHSPKEYFNPNGMPDEGVMFSNLKVKL